MATPSITPPDAYVYYHRRATTGEIFYVGKGSGRRAWDHKDRNAHWHNVVKRYGLVVEIVDSGLQEWYAFEREIELIAYHGRKDLGYGPLVNWTDGGEGSSNPSVEIRNKISKANTGKKHTDETKANMSRTRKGRRLSENQKTALLQSNLTRIVSEDTRAKMSAIHKGKKLSASHRAALIAANTGRVCSNETKAKMSASKQNISPETRLKLSLAAKARYAKKETGTEVPVPSAV